MRTKLRALTDRIAYYELAYGHLAEADSDLGVIAEYMVGKLLGCLPPSRKVNAKYDLIMKDGTTIEVKATGKKQSQSGGRPSIYRWDVGTQLHSIKNQKRPQRASIESDLSTTVPLLLSTTTKSLQLAKCWLFLIANFPPESVSRSRFDVFDPKYWTVYCATGAQLAAAGVTRYVTESTLRRLNISPLPLASLPRAIKNILTSRDKSAAEKGTAA